MKQISNIIILMKFCKLAEGQADLYPRLNNY